MKTNNSHKGKERLFMEEQLIKLRSMIRETIDRLDGENPSSEKKRNQRNMIVGYLEQASIEAGSLLRELREEH